jgi:site-specific recombinase XerD
VRAYAIAVRQLAAFLAERGMPTVPASIAAEHLREFLLVQRSASTARLRHAALRVFFRHLEAEGEIRAGKNPMLSVRPPKLPDDEAGRAYLDDDAFARMLAAIRRRKPPTFADRRDLAILLVLRTGGLRRAECAGLSLGHIDTAAGHVVVRHGKGDKARVAMINDDAIAAVIRYVGARVSRKAASDVHLWLGIDGRPLSPEAIGAIVERRAKAAGLGHVTAHELRHLYADDMKRRGASDETLRSLGGWTDPRTLQRYERARQRERAIDE